MISLAASSFIEKCQQELSDDSALATMVKGFVSRPSQIALATAIAKSLSQKSILVAEAGTGTGKTFAYLIPCLLSGKKAIISTATKTLQDQLFEKDLPLLKKALSSPARVYSLKGRANYLCKHRIDLHSGTAVKVSPETADALLIIQKKVPRLKVGERSELTEIKEDSPVWPYVTSTEDNCLKTECSHFHHCFLVKARRRALEADLLIINHHLFFADSRIKEDKLGELLPTVDMIVFDEAHKLPDIATEFYGQHKGSRQLMDLIDALIKDWPPLDLVNQPLKPLRLDLEKTLSTMLFALEREEERIPFEKLKKNRPFMEGLQETLHIIESFKAAIDKTPADEKKILIEYSESLDAFKALLVDYNAPETRNWIRWIERFKHSFVLHLSPFEVAKSFSTDLASRQAGLLFTSATLTVNESFDCFSGSLGLKEAETLIAASPFNYQKQALLYLPRGLPDTHSSNYNTLLVERVLPIIQACGGRCFFLFTSHKALNAVASLLSTLSFPLFVQGQEEKSILLTRFRQAGNAVLLGTSTFWEGVDVKGEALSCVIIDKIPFPSPGDPVFQGKSHYLQTQGESGFFALSLPMAVLALKQGIGRLIRDIDDKGILVLADPRLTGRAYGKQVFASLPRLQKTRDLQKALTFIQQFDIKHEITSN